VHANTALHIAACSQAAPAAAGAWRARASRRPSQLQAKVRADETGFIEQDNSGRANIFPNKQQAYIRSSTSDAAASQGLGGLQGERSRLQLWALVWRHHVKTDGPPGAPGAGGLHTPRQAPLADGPLPALLLRCWRAHPPPVLPQAACWWAL
jgi:hypothetical protein